MLRPHFFSLLLLLALTTAASPLLAETAPTVLFDQGHNQRFLIDGEGALHLSGLAAQFGKQGIKVAAHTGELTTAALNGIDGLVISGAFNSFSPAEVDAVAGFIEHGGRVAIMLHIGPPLVQLLERLGVVPSGSSIHERENMIKEQEGNFRTTALEPHELTQGLEYFSLYGAWALLNDKPNVSVLASTSDKAWIDLNSDKKLTEADAVQKFAVAVTGTIGKGSFVVFGDDAIFQNQYLDEANLQLAANLAKWMK